jgi:hypothetical protein
MKTLPLPTLIMTGVLPLLLASCLFKDPVFSDGFAKTDDSIVGVWVAEDAADDPEKAELAACFKVDDMKYMLHYPAREKDGVYFALQPLKLRDRDLLQVQALGTLKDGAVKPGDTEVFTLVWIEKAASGKIIAHPLNGKLEKKGPAAVRKLLEDPASDWNELFVEPVTFERITKK